MRSLKRNSAQYDIYLYAYSTQKSIFIYCVLIVNLLLGVVKKSVRRKWSFSNLFSFCRIHLFNYIHLTKFLENHENELKIDDKNNNQLGLLDEYLAPR